jgi:pyrophosphate--fructose-6-phosphate 1-phosphotransferase
MIQKQLLLERDPHGNVQVSLIETERLLAEMVSNAMKKIKNVPFHALPHFFGYEGRSAFPSNFDASYCYTLGRVASLVLASKLSGYMCFVSHLDKEVDRWDFGAVPLASLTHLEMRKGKLKPVIEKALVDLKGKPFKFFAQQRALWRLEDKYCFPGPIQFDEGTLLPPLSLLLENR